MLFHANLDLYFLFLVLGVEQDWKLVESRMDAASNGLCSASKELCVASMKAKAASGAMAFSN